MSAVDLRCIQRLRALLREVRQGENPSHSTPAGGGYHSCESESESTQEKTQLEREEEEEAEALSRFAASD